ncbi:MAG: 50S ribosomal protein L16 [Nanoarchaeota archaeon]|nr:50S ribosomal protein L16 [Nanoarchaeota archaeon]
MASLRKGKCYRNLVRPFTRKSKVKSKSYIKTIPSSRVVRYEMGDSKKKFKYEINLVSKEKAQIRHNALESARQVTNRRLQLKLGNTGYYLQIKAYPHHILRENKMLSGAHADRLQTGMSHSFGKPVGLASQIKKGKIIFTLKLDDTGLDVGKEAMKLAIPRIPVKCFVEVKKVE